MACVIAIDAGTTGVRALAVDEQARVIDVEYREITQYFPRPAWVEHDAQEIWDAVAATVSALARRQSESRNSVAAIGVTNQRETVVAWDKRTGRPIHRAIVWQDRRTADACALLAEGGRLPLVRDRTGLVLDPYFSATKMAWLLREVLNTVPSHSSHSHSSNLAIATVDSWIVWNLTGGSSDGVFATEPSNAARTMLLDIRELSWSAELSELFGVPIDLLPEVRPSCGRFGTVKGALGSSGSPLHGVPVSGVAGDQQAALFGQACFSSGMAKATYGTGTFVLVNLGEHCPAPADGLLTTVAWDLGARSTPAVSYALEGAVFATGAAIQWLRDGLGLIDDAADLEPLARQVADTEGVHVVPGFTGLGSPWWDPYARGLISGLSRGAGRAHVARAVVEAMAFQVRDVIDTMRRAGATIDTLRVDGGASVMDLLLQFQSDQARVAVTRPTSTETTALGAATLAGLAEGFWGSLDDLSRTWRAEVEMTPKASAAAADSRHEGWLRAVERARGWARGGGSGG